MTDDSTLVRPPTQHDFLALLCLFLLPFLLDCYETEKLTYLNLF